MARLLLLSKANDPHSGEPGLRSAIKAFPRATAPEDPAVVEALRD